MNQNHLSLFHESKSFLLVSFLFSERRKAEDTICDMIMSGTEELQTHF